MRAFPGDTGERAAHELACHKRPERADGREGYARHGPSGLRLTSQGLQKVAWYILQEIFKLRKNDRLSRRDQAPNSNEPPAAHETRAYRFGDPLHLDLSRSVLNAVKRAGIQLPVRLGAEDFVVYEREPFPRSATVLLIDMSKSMQFENRYNAAKKVALALHELIRLRFPQDRVAVVSFSMQAKKSAPMRFRSCTGMK